MIIQEITRKIIDNNHLYDHKILHKMKEKVLLLYAIVSTEYVLIQDADLEYSRDYQRLFEPINQNADEVYGSRFTGSDKKGFSQSCKFYYYYSCKFTYKHKLQMLRLVIN